MLTIFSVPKAFEGHVGTIQINAVRSWTLLAPVCEVILLGDEKGTAETAGRLGARHIADVECNEWGTPLISSAFDIAQRVAGHAIMCYVNADIILLSDFLPAIGQVRKESFLLVGQRWDVNLTGPVEFDDPAWEATLRDHLERGATLHRPDGIDYFVFPRGMYRDIPDFAVGRIGWDNWMVYHARSRRVPVVDATEIVTVVHQNHDYSHLSGGKTELRKGRESEQNRHLLGGQDHALSVHDATWVLGRDGMRRQSRARVLFQARRRFRNRLASQKAGIRRRLSRDR